MTITQHERRLAVEVTWKAGDTVEVDGNRGIVQYVYTNGFTLVQFPGKKITGGIFNNDSTYSNDLITH